jgi:hypothetical protein
VRYARNEVELLVLSLFVAELAREVIKRRWVDKDDFQNSYTMMQKEVADLTESLIDKTRLT